MEIVDQPGRRDAKSDMLSQDVQIEAPVTSWEVHPLGPEFGARWAGAACLTTITWRGPHALQLAGSPVRCALVAVDASWLVLEEQDFSAVLRERYRLSLADWSRLACAVGHAGPPWIIADARTWAAVDRLLAELRQFQSDLHMQRRLLRDAHDLLGVEIFTPLAELPTRTGLRAAIAALLAEHR